MCINRREQHNDTVMSKSKATIGEILGHADASPTASLLHCMAACVTELYYKGISLTSCYVLFSVAVIVVLPISPNPNPNRRFKTEPRES